jgi:hypothetical protein
MRTIAGFFGAAVLFMGCSPRVVGSGEQQVASSTNLDFSYSGYNWSGVPDATPVARTVEDWKDPSKIRFYVSTRSPFSALIQAVHPKRSFRNLNGGPLQVDEDGFVKRYEDGRLFDGNVKSKEGLIEGVILRTNKGNIGLPLFCFGYLSRLMLETCADAESRRYLDKVRKVGGEFVYSHAGKGIARASQESVAYRPLGPLMDPEEEARQDEQVHIVTLAPGVSVWGGVLSGSSEQYITRSGTCQGAAQPVNGVFMRSLPAGYSGAEEFVADAQSDAACSLQGQNVHFKTRCTRYHRDADPAKDLRFCLEAEVVDIRGDQDFPKADGGFGIWLVVDARSARAATGSGTSDSGTVGPDSQGASQGSGEVDDAAAHCAQFNSRTACAFDWTRQCKWIGYSGEGSCVTLDTVAPDGVPDFSRHAK